MDWSGRIAVVTGASSGIGAAVARDLARRGVTVVAAARRADRLAEVVADCQRHAPASVAHCGDLAVLEECQAVVQETEERFGRVDILVNNAGFSVRKDATSTTSDDVVRLMAVNFFAPVHLTMAALPGMLSRQAGSIVNVTSVAGSVPNPREAAYGASKAALSRWSDGLAVELAGRGIHVGILSPGPIDTEIWGHGGEVLYHGRRFPPELVAAGVARMVEHRIARLTVPRRYGAVGAVYPLLGRPIRWGMRRYEARAARA